MIATTGIGGYMYMYIMCKRKHIKVLRIIRMYRDLILLKCMQYS